MKSKIKNESKKALVEEYQKQVKASIDRLKSIDGKPSSRLKEYIENLELNIKRAPYVLGYMEWPEDKKIK